MVGTTVAPELVGVVVVVTVTLGLAIVGVGAAIARLAVNSPIPNRGKHDAVFMLFSSPD